MRPLIALGSLPLFVVFANAGPAGGGSSGGGGALSGVSAGIGGASRGGGGGGGGGAPPSSQPPSRPPSEPSWDDRAQDSTRSTRAITEYCYDGTGRAGDPHGVDDCRRPAVHHDGNEVIVRRRARFEPPAPPAQISFYAGAQKVHDSDGSASIEIALTDWRLRLTGTYSRYFERQPGAGLLTMQMPTLTAGIRIDDMGATAVYIEGGVSHVRTDGDRMGDTKLTGPLAGMRIEHAIDRQIMLLGDVQQMWFPHEIRATGARVGVRYKFVQASFRVLDFNVGPPLYGPEVGVRF